MAKHFQAKNSRLKGLFEDYQRQVAQYTQPRVFKRKFKVRCAKIDVSNNEGGNLLGLDELRYAFIFAKSLLEQQELDVKQISIKK